MNDIFLDTNLAKNLINPAEEEYIDFLNWLNKEGALVISKKLLIEYGRGNQNLIVTINNLTIHGRINFIDIADIKKFILPKKIIKKLLSNRDDHHHLITLLLSNRKLGIIADNNFRKDVNKYPKIDGIKPSAGDSPSNINYQGSTLTPSAPKNPASAH